jgi:hypothetical protein
VTHLHVYPGMTTALQPQFHTTEQQSMIDKLREMDESLTFGQFCHVIKDTNSEIRHVRKVSATGQVCFYTHGGCILRMRMCHVRARSAGRAHAESSTYAVSRMRMCRFSFFASR